MQKMKKIVVTFILFMMLFTQTGVTFAHVVQADRPSMESTEGYITGPFNEEEDVREILENTSKSRTFSTQSSPSEASNWTEFKQVIYEKMINRENSIIVNYTGDISNKDYWDHVTRCVNEIFEEDHYLWYHFTGGKYSASFIKDGIQFRLDWSYRTNKAQEDYVTERVDDILSDITTSSMTDREKVKAIHDYIVLNVKYDTSEDTSQGKYTAYAALSEGKAVCQGYALLGYRMLNEVGISSRIIASNAMNHAWNLVNLDNQWVHMDITWDDPIPDKKGRVIYDYYLLTDVGMKKAGHNWKDSEYPTSGEGAFYNNVSKARQNVNQSFLDVPTGDWAYDFIENLASQDIISGYEDGTFKPNNKVTRAQAAKMIVNAAGIDYKGKVSDFVDAPKGHWATEYIAAAKDAGILSGYGDEFKPNDQVTRAQIAKMIVNAFNIQNTGVDVNFEDVSDDLWSKEFIETLAGHDIVSGYKDGTFKPENKTTRAQFSKILSNAMSI